MEAARAGGPRRMGESPPIFHGEEACLKNRVHFATCSQGTDSSIDQQILHNSPNGLVGKEPSCPMHSAWVPSQVLCELSANLERPRR